MGHNDDLSDSSMPPLPQVSLLNFSPARSASVNCKCYYCETEAPTSNNSKPSKPRSARPYKPTERMSAEVHSAYPLLNQSLTSSKLPLKATSATELHIKSFTKWFFMAEQLHTRVGGGGGKARGHGTLEQW